MNFRQSSNSFQRNKNDYSGCKNVFLLYQIKTEYCTT